jgi:mycothiol synthase
MSDSLRLSVPDLSEESAAAEFYRVADAARDVDGYDPFNEQARFDVAAGRRTPIIATVWSEQQHGRAIGAAILGHGELDFVIDPVFRGKAYGETALAGILPNAQGDLTAWSHGDHAAARVLARRHGFELVRTLLQLRLSPLPDAAPSATAEGTSAGVTIATFHPGIDDAEWVALNARIFATHPEQGAVTAADLVDRQAEAWFDPDDFIVARDESGTMIGYNWLKIDPGAGDGEIYVIGVDSSASGRGLGRRLMGAGLDRMRERGCTAATLYVEADNAAAVHLYRSLGFVEHTIDVQYRRTEIR